jgi:hypothetical protein
MEPYRVFISSIMNPENEDLTAERRAARSAVERFAPLTKAWAFEAEPASSKPLLVLYLDAAKTCDVFVLILGEHATNPVRDEVQVALDYAKPILLFCKELPARDAETQELLHRINVKYVPFIYATELQDKVRISIGHHLLGLIRGETSTPSQLGDRLARLRRFKEERRAVKILPTLPVCKHNSFTVEEVNPAHVVFQQGGMANVTVPAERIAQVLDAGPHASPIVHVGGRLQWITARKNWYFHLEKTPEEDPFSIGIGKEVPRQPILSSETQNLLRPNPLTFAWSNPENLAGREVFFDEDGKHLKNGRQILTCGSAQM